MRTAIILLAAIVLPVIGEPQPAPAQRPVVYAYFPAKAGSWKTDGIDWPCITHLCYRSVELQADGSLKTPLGDPPKDFVDNCHRHRVKLTLLVWVTRTEISDAYLASAPEKAAANLLAYVKKHNLDGVNIDDEKLSQINGVAKAPNRDLLTRFFQILNKTFRAERPDYHLSFAAPPVISKEDKYGVTWIDYAAIAKEVDAIIPMGYTMNPPTIGWTTNAEPIAGGGKVATTTTRDLATLVADYKQAMGGSSEKLLLGISLSFGGHEWTTRTDQPLSPTIGKPTPLTLDQAHAAAKQYGRQWDEKQQSPWYRYSAAGQFHQGWYNDPESWRAKLKWVKDQKLPGIAIWVIDAANDPMERWELLREYGH